MAIHCWLTAYVQATHATRRTVRHALHHHIGLPRRAAHLIATPVAHAAATGAILTCVVVPSLLFIPGLPWPGGAPPMPLGGSGPIAGQLAYLPPVTDIAGPAPIHVPEPSILAIFAAAVIMVALVKRSRAT